METKPEEATPQNPVAEETPQVPETPEETPKEISAEELTELQKKADVSSQNFERAKKAEESAKQLAEEKKALEEKLKETEVLSEVDDDDVKSTVSELKAKLAKSEITEQFPELKEVWNELEAFHAEPENKGMTLEAAAKVFRVEKGLTTPTRKGLEKSTGGDRVVVTNNNKMSAEDAAKLRSTDYKKYREMVKQGRIKVS